MSEERPEPRAPERAFEIVALVASLGGLEAVASVLGALPASFPAAVIVAQHLGADPAAFTRLVARRTKLPVTWAADGARVEPGHVYLVPRYTTLTLLPERVQRVAPSAASSDFAGPVDALLRSMAATYRARALAVVLTGMGGAGAEGVRAVKELGGTVFAQDEASSMSFGMPGAAIATGCVDLVLPLQEIGAVIGAVVAKEARVPRARPDASWGEQIFLQGGHTGALMRRIDWSRTPIGPVDRWPDSVRVMVATALAALTPMFVCCGPELLLLYNDACLPALGTKHPRAMGQSARECWADAWDRLGPAFDRVLHRDEPVTLEDQPLFTVRSGAVEESYVTLSFSPVHGERGMTAAVLITMIDRTAGVLQVRRLRTLRELAAQASAATSALEACETSAAVISEAPADVPFALLYLSDRSTGRAHLTAAAGLAPGQPSTPRIIDLGGVDEAWPIGDALRAGEPVVVHDVVERFRTLPCEPWGDSPAAALITPLVLDRAERPLGAAVLGVSPRRELDAAYRDFLELVAAQIALSITNAVRRQAMGVRTERFAALDRAKTAFFGNVSHELRAPLALVLEPLGDLLAEEGRGALSPAQREAVALAHRGALRVLDFVSILLEFSELQAQRIHPSFALVDLAACTRGLCSLLREAAERAGLRLVVDCAPLPEPVAVDRAMWEKIVLGLLANAIASTPEGVVEVTLRPAAGHVELRVRDGGPGIGKDEMPYVFDLFRPVPGTLARTSETAAARVALVRELVQLHRGQVQVESTPGEGTTFTVWVPASLPAQAEVAGAADATADAEIVEAALRQATARLAPAGAVRAVAPATAAGARRRVLHADPDADLRAYVGGVLSERWEVEAVADGAAALEAVRARRPDLVLCEVRMPALDGFELIRKIRAERALRSIPIVLLTARAAEDAVAEGLELGADDVVLKPVSTRELVARVDRQIRRRRRG